MVLYLVGLGLGDEKDITVKGLETVRKCSKVYLEHYTSILGVGKERLVRSSVIARLIPLNSHSTS
jgi:diphthine synthase